MRGTNERSGCEWRTAQSSLSDKEGRRQWYRRCRASYSWRCSKLRLSNFDDLTKRGQGFLILVIDGGGGASGNGGGDGVEEEVMSEA